MYIAASSHGRIGTLPSRSLPAEVRGRDSRLDIGRAASPDHIQATVTAVLAILPYHLDARSLVAHSRYCLLFGYVSFACKGSTGRRRISFYRTGDDLPLSFYASILFVSRNIFIDQ